MDNPELRHAVAEELEWVPHVDASHLAQEIEVRMPEAQRQSGDEIAHRVVSVLRWVAGRPSHCIQIQVEDGIVTLIGPEESPFTIQIDGRKVVLTGYAPSANDPGTAENTAWPAAAADEVDNRLLGRS